MPAPQTKLYACTQFDDAGRCVAAVWVDQPTVLPPLSVRDGNAIGMQMFGAIVIVYAMRKLLNQAI